MKIEPVTVLGMPLIRYTHKSCTADVAEDTGWATVYFIASREQGKGHATELMRELKKIYEKKGKKFGCTVDLNPAIRHICDKLNIEIYDKEYDQ